MGHLGLLVKDLSRNFDLSINMAHEWGLIALHGHEEKLEKSSSLKQPIRF